MKRSYLSNAGFYAALCTLLLLFIAVSLQWKRSKGAREALIPPRPESSLRDEGVLTVAAVDEGVASADEAAADANIEEAVGVEAEGAEEFAAAAAENARLKTELEWTFGGKTQRGWYLYAALIKETLGTEKSEESRAFAEALARWQKSNGLAARGVLDTDTLSRLISLWQSRRIKDKTVPPADKLLTAPPADFYDPSRAEELRRVEPQAYAAYKRMVAAAAIALNLGRTRDGSLASGEQYLKIVSAFRSPEYQEKLRQQSPNSGPAGLAKVSPHFTGRALDLYVGGEPVSTEDSNRAVQVNTRVYQWLVKNAQKFGFYPYFYEPWHWEYVGQ